VGTNYFVRVNECSCCNRYEELHVGKSGNTVQAYTHPEWSQPGDADWNPTPIGEIRSWRDWRRLMWEHKHTVWNEYGVEMSDDNLIAIFESSTMKARGSAHQWALENRGRYPEVLADSWLDDEGFSMTSREFS